MIGVGAIVVVHKTLEHHDSLSSSPSLSQAKANEEHYLTKCSSTLRAYKLNPLILIADGRYRKVNASLPIFAFWIRGGFAGCGSAYSKVHVSLRRVGATRLEDYHYIIMVDFESGKPARSKLDVDFPITRDVACIRCEYNLRGLKLDGVCPECEDAIAHSTVKPPFDCDHEWVMCMRSTARMLFFGTAIFVLITLLMLVVAVPRFTTYPGVVGNLFVVLAFFILFNTACACQLADHMSDHVRVRKRCVYFMRSSIFFPFLLILLMIPSKTYFSSYTWHTMMPYFAVVVLLMQLAVPAMFAFVMRDLGHLISLKVVRISNWIIILSIPIPYAAFVATMAMLLVADFETISVRWGSFAVIPIASWSILVSVLICWLMVVLRSLLSRISRMIDFHDGGERGIWT